MNYTNRFSQEEKLFDLSTPELCHNSTKITTLPFGHHGLREEMFMRNVVQDPDWGSSDEEETVVHVAESLTPESQLPTQYTGPQM